MVGQRRRSECLVRSGACRRRNASRLTAYGVLCGVALLVLSASPAFGAVLNVPADHGTIQAAIDAAVNGDTVLVQPGTHVENINFKGKAITVTSTDPSDPDVVAATIIDGGGNGTVVLFNRGETGASVLTGFTIRNGKGQYGGAIHCSSSSPTITRNTITGSSAVEGGGIWCQSSSSPTILSNTISANSAQAGGGIGLWDNSSPDIADNTIAGNSATGGVWPGGGGISMGHYCAPNIMNNTISENSAPRAGGGIRVGDDSSPTITGNTIRGNSGSAGGAIYLYNNCSPEIRGNQIIANSATDRGGGICYITNSSPTIADNIISENSVVGGGDYALGGGIRCGDCSGQILNNTITNNSVTGGILGSAGGGIYCHTSFSGTIQGNTITGNSAGSGGGIDCYSCSPTIVANIITGNSASGAELSNGGGIYCNGSSPTITGNTITENSADWGGAGISMWNNCSAEIRGNDISRNSAKHGVAIWLWKGSPQVTQNIITGNTVDVGVENAAGGIELGGSSSPMITGNTISGNGVHGIHCFPGELGEEPSPTVTGNTISGNGGWGIKCEDSAAANAATLEGDNTLGTNGSGQVLQCWHGLVKVIFGDGSPAAGASVSILNNDGDTTPDYGSPFTTSTDGFAPDSADPADSTTWPPITEFEVDNAGVRHTLIPQTILASLGAGCGTATHSWNGRYQIAEVKLNHPPIIADITGPEEPVSVSTTIQMSGNFTDADVGDAHTAEWDWGDETADTVAPAVSPVSGSHSYNAPGVYTVTLTVTDAAGASDTASFQYVVVYEASAGFVTGGGWIDSPSGAYAADSSLAGKANFGFVAKYKKGATTPSGQTEFRFHAGDLDFHSTEYQWLVVAGAHAKFKGSGTVNGEGTYGFMLTATDGDIAGGGGTDKFRIKITDGDSVVYDNKMGEPGNSDAATELGGGSIVIHGEK